jgi:hypothetical protein
MNATAGAATIEENSILDRPEPSLAGKSLLYNPNAFRCPDVQLFRLRDGNTELVVER